MFNKVIIAGNLTRDIDMKFLPSGAAIANTGIATTKKFKNQMGEDKEEVLFVDIAFFGRRAEIAQQYLRKGSKVLIEGRLKLDSWTDQNGQKRSKHSVSVDNMQMLDSKGSNAPAHVAQKKEDPIQVSNSNDNPFDDDIENETIPF